MLTIPEDMANCFINYFSNIFTSQNSDLQNGGPPVVDEQIDDPFINSIPDKKEILQVLKEMKRNASPRPNGLNAAFYIATWKWIGDDVTQVVQSFFTHVPIGPTRSLSIKLSGAVEPSPRHGSTNLHDTRTDQARSRRLKKHVLKRTRIGNYTL